MRQVAFQLLGSAKMLQFTAHRGQCIRQIRAYETDNRFHINPNQVAKPFRQQQLQTRNQLGGRGSLRWNRGRSTETIRHDALYLEQGTTPSSPNDREYTQTWNEFSEEQFAKPGAKKQFNPVRKPRFDD